MQIITNNYIVKKDLKLGGKMKKDWLGLNGPRLGRYAEYFSKMEFTKAGFDVFTSEVDDKGIDFVIRKNAKEYFDIQNKSLNFPRTNYVFMEKSKFTPNNNLYLSLIIFEKDRDPIILLIPSLDWKNKNHSALVDRDYEGKKSKPEYGININKSNNLYNFEKQLSNL